MDESEWRDDPESIAEWIAWVDTIKPLVLTDEERADMERYWAEYRRFNIEAVRHRSQSCAEGIKNAGDDYELRQTPL